MTTLDDDASMREEQFREAALAKRKPNGPAATGHCLYCNAELPNGRRFCDGWCAEDWQLEREAKVRNRGKI